MAPTARQAAQLRSLLRKFNMADQLHRVPGPGKTGRHSLDGKEMLHGLELAVRTVMRERKIERLPALRWIVGNFPADVLKTVQLADGGTVASVAKRLNTELSAAGYDKKSLRSLVPPGINARKFTVRFTRWRD